MISRIRKLQSAVLLAATFAFTSTTFAANLLEIYQLASLNDPEWAAKKAKFLGDRESVDQAFGGLLPTVGVSAQYGQQEYNGVSTDAMSNDADSCADFITDVTNAVNDLGNNVIPDQIPIEGISGCRNVFGNTATSTQTSTTQSYSFRLSQPLFRADRWFKYKGAQSYEKAQESKLALAQQDLILKVAKGYFGVLKAEEEYRLAKMEKNSLETQLTEIKNRYKLGLARDTDLFEMQGTYDLSTAAEVFAQVTLDNIKEDLALVTGQDRVMVTPLPHNIPVDAPKPLDIKDWENFAKQNNYQIIAARFALETAEKQVQEKRTGHYPTVDFAIDHTNSQGSSGLVGDTKITTIGLTMNLPLFSGGIVSSQEKQARHKKAEAKHNLQLATRNAVRETRQYHRRVSADASTFESRKRAVKSNNSAFKAIKAGYKSGLRTLSDVLRSQKKVFTAKKELTTARFDYITNTLHLKKASGILNPNDLEVLNGWLDTDARNISNSEEDLDLTAKEIGGIELDRGVQLRSFDDEKDTQPTETTGKSKTGKKVHRSLFDAYKEWANSE
ncbi:MAG: hypothetical protein COA99_04840 [Moraxellaceae bacterium]|nr:MAG: hypothetical protein COA99_04840 [Moraxellaceae bacterium]